MSDMSIKWAKFWQSFWVNEGYKRVLSEGLTNTLIIAVSGLLIGILIGTVIAAVKVMPKYKLMPRILDGICSVYVGFFAERLLSFSCCWRTTLFVLLSE